MGGSRHEAPKVVEMDSPLCNQAISTESCARCFAKFSSLLDFLCSKSAEFSAETGAKEVFPKLSRVTEWKAVPASQL